MRNKNKSAILLGASGLTGSSLLNILLEDNTYTEVKIFVRKSLNISHPKLTVHIIDFDKPHTYEKFVQGDVIFCCLGTTIKQAGSQAAFRSVDYSYPVNFGKIAKQNGIQQYLLVSSIGANANSSVFYLRTKGECETGIKETGINSISVFRPASLSGKREIPRTSEKISLGLLNLLSFLLVGKLKKYKPIKAKKVAEAMFKASLNARPGFNVYESDAIQAM